jgi:DNA polymerase-3 subunit delta
VKADKRAIEKAAPVLAPDIRLVLLHGPDDAQARELADRLIAGLSARSEGLERVDLAPGALASDPAQLADEAASISMFGGARAIRVDGAGDESTAATEALLEAATAGNPVVMVAGALKGTSKLLKAVLASPLALAYACYPLEGRAATEMVAEACAARGLRPSRDAEAMLAAAFGAERGVLAQELDKLALYLGAEPGRETPLDVEAIHALGAAISDSDFGGLVEAVAGGDPAEAERQAAKLNQNGIAAIGQLRAVARRMWQLGESAAAVESGMSAREAVKAQRPPVFWKDQDRLTAQASRWSARAARRALSRLLDAERRIKMRGSAPAELLASEALTAIASFAAGRRNRR